MGLAACKASGGKEERDDMPPLRTNAGVGYFVEIPARSE